MMNLVVLTGRLTKDVELRGEDNKVGVLTLAINRKYTNQQGDREADFPQVKTFKKLAENCAKYLKKGSLVTVQAEVRTGSYEKDGKRQFTMELVANDVQFLDPRQPSNSNSNQTSRGHFNQEPPNNYQDQDQDPFSGAEEIQSDEIPSWLR